MKGFNPIAQLTSSITELATTLNAFIAKVDTMFAEINARFDKVDARFDRLEARLDQVIAYQKEDHAKLLEMDAKLDFLVAEVSRYKNDSNELLISVYAYCSLNNIPFSHNDLFHWGSAATRFSRVNGYKVEKTNDPRFGVVNLYEKDVLTHIIEGS